MTPAPRRELAESLHARNHYTPGTNSHANLTKVVTETLDACSEDMANDLHREYYASPIMAKRIHTGFRWELPAAQIHEMAVLTKCLPEADNKTLIEHIKAFNTYSECGLVTSENYALEDERTKVQCRALLTVSYHLHNIDYRMLAWVKTPHATGNETCPRIKDKNLIAYILDNPDHALIIIKAAEERGPDFDLDLLRHMGTTVSSISEGIL